MKVSGACLLPDISGTLQNLMFFFAWIFHSLPESKNRAKWTRYKSVGSDRLIVDPKRAKCQSCTLRNISQGCVDALTLHRWSDFKTSASIKISTILQDLIEVVNCCFRKALLTADQESSDRSLPPCLFERSMNFRVSFTPS